MIIVTTNDLPGYRVTSVVGLARGITVRSRSIVGNIGGAIQSIFGGNISVYTNLAEQARSEALWTCNGLVPVTCLSLCHLRFESQWAYSTQICVAPSGIVEAVDVAIDRSFCLTARGPALPPDELSFNRFEESLH